MTTAIAERPIPPLAAVARFFRTPKGLLTAVLAVILAIAIPAAASRGVWLSLAGSVLAAVLLDAPILRWREGAWAFPSGALLTGLLVAMVLSPMEPWYVGACTSAIAIGSKYLLRGHSANVLNPAAFGLVVTFYVFSTGQSWWGALGDAPAAAVVLLFATGLFISSRVNKLPMVLAFLGAYYALFTAAAFAGNPGFVAEMFIAPDVQAALFFAFFILTDPPTSPTRYRDQVVCGVLVAVVSFAVFEVLGVAYYLLAGVLAGNVYEAGRRMLVRAHRHRT